MLFHNLFLTTAQSLFYLLSFLGRHRIGSLRFQLSDGLNKAEKGKTYTFNVRVKDLSIHLERHESLDVFPMMQATLRPDNLLVTTSDKASNRPITFLVKKSPKMGRLLLRIPSPDKVRTFLLNLWYLFLPPLNELHFSTLKSQQKFWP